MPNEDQPKKGRRMSVQAGPVATKPEPQPKAELRGKPGGTGKQGWCEFEANVDCYVEGCQLATEQRITLAPAAANRLRHNKNLTLVSGELPPEPQPGEPNELEEGDPKIGQNPNTGLRLIKQG